ncbi:MAG: DNA mismatch repair protein MutL [Chlamydiales bacterium]|nr:DNA mismatch repair protein MutL [Chlamydiales bacterium]
MLRQKIHLLDEHTINQIAAGEVIENPASVVKELVENSLDSGAFKIEIETRAGGRALIQVSDDGEGMGESDLILCLERHATSKLSTSAELDHIHSLGFRGEALPSIASVSKMRLHSCMEEDQGRVLHVEGGKLGALSPLPRQRGTTIEVKSLFFNVPVRKRFQKSVAWDVSEVHKVLIQFALCNPHIAFSWVNDGQQQLIFSKDETLEQRICASLGEEIAHALLPVEQKEKGFHLHGYICRPSVHRPNRTGQMLFMNGRIVTSSFVSKKVLEGFGTRLSTHRFPLFFLHLKISNTCIDVNVHPQKKEVRLHKMDRLGTQIIEAIERSLQPQESVQRVPKINFPQFEPVASLFAAEPPPPVYTAPKQVSLPLISSIEIVGRVNHYLFVQEELGVRVIDTKRAYERIIYHHLLESKEMQALLLPLHLDFQGKEKALLLEHIEKLNGYGLSIRHFGGDTFIVDAIPALMEPMEIADFLSAYLENGTIPKKIGRCLQPRDTSIEMGKVIVSKLMSCKDSEFTPSGQKIHSLLDASQLKKML